MWALLPMVERLSFGRHDPLRRAMGLLSIRRRSAAVALLFGSGGALSALSLAVLSAWLITRAWMMPPVLSLMIAVTTVRALGIARGVLRYLERLSSHDLALDAMSTARERFYRALASGRPGYSVSLRRGDLLARTGEDIDDVGDAYIRAFIPIGVAAVTSIAAVAIMCLVSLWAAVVLALALIFAGVVAPLCAAYGNARCDTDSAMAHTIAAEAMVTALRHGTELAVARQRSVVIARMAAADRSESAARERGLRWTALSAGSVPAAIGISVIAAAVIGVGLADSVAPMTLGILILLPLSAFESTGPLIDAGIALQRSRNAAGRVLSMTDSADAGRSVQGDPPTPIPTPTSLRLCRLRWGFDADLGPREGLTAVFEAGSRVAVVGPSGVGKTALLLTIAGLLEPRAGTVIVDGDPRQQIRYFAEDGHIFATSVRENIRVAGGNATEPELLSVLSRVGLGEWISGLPDGIDTVLSGGSDALSGGQRRRLLLARALLSPAPVILLDEPGEHLDSRDADRLHHEILGFGEFFGREQTVIMVTHRLPADIRAEVVVLG